ncbi:TIGR02391 family protein [Blastococcus sp. VKM Ac-2987]|uniref:TIGR02391 family protein n=1 Tax=Blastococcus sp. VKM Ac-2987 TaxID=3004141 RepID=UPI0022AB8065|nr:TIGR02391 family protein [Blastococcus sp. VKM Ac-2987]MCZ2857741.1 TIGR02391 family protein [Blastococcus sp. VKM Ac-2987]
MVIDVGWALGQLQQFISLDDLRQQRELTAARRGGYDDTADHPLVAEAPVIEQILDRVTPAWRSQVDQDPMDRWLQHREASRRAMTMLSRAEELRQRLGDDAPTLNAGHLHPWVWEGARSMWQSGHFRQAVVDAAKRINAETQNKLTTRASSETDLTNQAFSDDLPKTDRPRLRLPEDDDGKTAKSMRRGIRAYAEGCFAAIRNPAAHDDLDEMTEDEALEQLAAFSVLARWIDRAKVVTAP